MDIDCAILPEIFLLTLVLGDNIIIIIVVIIAIIIIALQWQKDLPV